MAAVDAETARSLSLFRPLGASLPLLPRPAPHLPESSQASRSIASRLVRHPLGAGLLVAPLFRLVCVALCNERCHCQAYTLYSLYRRLYLGVAICIHKHTIVTGHRLTLLCRLPAQLLRLLQIRQWERCLLCQLRLGAPSTLRVPALPGLEEVRHSVLQAEPAAIMLSALYYEVAPYTHILLHTSMSIYNQ